MKKQITAFFMAWGSYCAIPCPHKVWAEESRVWTPVYLPVIGLVIGAVWALVVWLTDLLALPHFLTAALRTATPFLLSGFFHLDGFMDCCDAILSRRDLPRRQEILKDSHVGSFAVICVALLFLTEFAIFSDLAGTAGLWAFVLLPAAVRCGSALSLQRLRPMHTSQYAGGFAEKKKTAQIVWLFVIYILVIAAAMLLGDAAAIACAAGALAAVLTAICCARQLGGVNGDCAGCAVTVGELVGLVCLLLSTHWA